MARAITSSEVKDRRHEVQDMKVLVADLTLEKLGTPRLTFSSWHDRHRADEPEALGDPAWSLAMFGAAPQTKSGP
jgi:hypothetical protein